MENLSVTLAKLSAKAAIKEDQAKKDRIIKLIKLNEKRKKEIDETENEIQQLMLELGVAAVTTNVKGEVELV